MSQFSCWTAKQNDLSQKTAEHPERYNETISEGGGAESLCEEQEERDYTDDKRGLTLICVWV
jgi:hypothetical protein